MMNETLIAFKEVIGNLKITDVDNIGESATILEVLCSTKS
jgi:hypothetical protein